MDTFLVIGGVLLVAIVVALVVLYAKNIDLKLHGLDVKHWLTIAGIAVLVIVLIVAKIVLGKRADMIEKLLIKLRISKAESDVKVIDEKLSNNKKQSEKIDQEIVELEKDFDSNKSKIDELRQKKGSIDQQIADLDSKKSGADSEKETLQDKISKMKGRLG